ncbi:riboflavin synthase domain-like protein [Flagelloscypha sp. PMI_526]|nr:riboflavin synthase domain-like protein [Flagelloscypha sp. PMI_526]
MAQDECEPLSPLILYATETGTAEDASNTIARECRRIRLDCRVKNLDSYSSEDLIAEEFVIFVVSTTGNGAHPRSMRALWAMLLRSDLPPDLFSEMSFAVFGLGDTAYERFCWPAKKLFRRLKALGANELCERGEGDEQHQLGIDGALDPWVSTLLDALLKFQHLTKAEVPVSSISLPLSAMSLTMKDSLPHTQPLIREDISSQIATVVCNRRVTADDWFQEVRHFEFSFLKELQYSPGDVAMIRPEPPPDRVQSFLNLMGWANDADLSVFVSRLRTDQAIEWTSSNTTSLRELFTYHLDFSAVPRRSFFLWIRHFAQDATEREKLEEFCQGEGDGAEDLYDYCFKPRRTILEVLLEFRSVCIPKDYIFDVFPALRAREFSIANSTKIHPKQIHLCVAIVKYKTMLKLPRQGLCTTYLSRLQPGDQIRIQIRPGFLRLPSSPSFPVICVGPGTGIAPMRAVIEERIHDGAKNNTLYFGSRSVSKDFYYGEEWHSYQRDETLFLRCAFSRDSPEGVKRTYVQNLIEQDGERIWQIMGKDNGFLFISGSSNKMPAAVRAAVAKAGVSFGNMSDDESIEWVAQLERAGKLIEECWS